MRQIQDLHALFVDELKDAYDFEHQILEALPKMQKSAADPELQKGFADHLEQTREQVGMLEQVFENLDQEPERKPCKGMKGLLQEGEDVVNARGDAGAIDAALIGAAQRVEHYEMAAYGTLRTFARTLGCNEEAQILQRILEQEAQTDERLSKLAERRINPRALEGAEQARAEGSDGRSARRSSARAGQGSSAGRGAGAGSQSTSGRGSARSGSARSASARGSSGRAVGRGSDGEPTREELYERAQQLGIEGRSKMNKRQLQREVQRHS